MNSYFKSIFKHFTLLLVFVGLCNLIPQSVLAQRRAPQAIEITGEVVNEDGDPIKYAGIHAGNGSIVAETDALGQFSITLRSNDYAYIEAIGYKSRIIAAGSLSGTTTLKKLPFQMYEEDEVNIPFGSIKKRQIAGAVHVINTDEILEFDSRRGVLGALNSRVPGLFGNANNRNIGASQVIVDGIPRSVGNINLQEVDQITVLSDASSRILYGVLADQGVIMVNTKRGHPFKREISVRTEYGLDAPISYPNFLNSYDFARLYNEARFNDGLEPRYDSTALEGYRTGSNPLLYPDQDYYNDFFLKDFRPNASVITEFRGGNESAQYYMNLGWNTTGTLLKLGEGANESSHAFNIRGNVDFQITEIIKMNLDVVGMFDVTHGYQGNFWNHSSQYHPNYYPMLIDTSQVYIPEDILGAARVLDGRYLIGGTSDYQRNIYGDLMLRGYFDRQNRTGQLNSGIDVDLKGITTGLTARAYLSFDIDNMYRINQTNSYAVYEPQVIDNDTIVVRKIGNDSFTGSQSVGTTDMFRYIGYFGTLDYNRTFNEDHKLSATALAFTDQSIYDNQIHRDVNLHFGLRANYMYQNKYIAELSGALPGSSKLSPENRFKPAYSAAFGWIATEEDFMANSFLDYLKLKASYALMHTDRHVGDFYLYLDNFTLGNRFHYADGQYRNYVLNFETIGNPGLTFASRREVNLGFESVMLNQDLWLTANFFFSNSFNRIQRLNNLYPAYLGGNFAFENYRSEQDQGFDIGLNYKKQINDFKVNVGTFAVISESKILQIDEPNYEWDYRSRVGKPTSAIFGWVAEGLFVDEDDIANHATQLFGTVQPGDIKYKDLNNDGVIDVNDQKMIGNNRATMQVGFNVNLSYKNIRLFALATYQGGGNNIYSSPYYWVHGDRKYSEVVLDRWTPETAATATYPRLSTQHSSNNFRNSTYWMADDSYLTLSAVELSYSMPLRNIGRQIRIYVRGTDLLTVSPTKKERELNIGNTPQFRRFAFGLTTMF